MAWLEQPSAGQSCYCRSFLLSEEGFVFSFEYKKSWPGSTFSLLFTLLWVGCGCSSSMLIRDVTSVEMSQTLNVWVHFEPGMLSSRVVGYLISNCHCDVRVQQWHASVKGSGVMSALLSHTHHLAQSSLSPCPAAWWSTAASQVRRSRRNQPVHKNRLGRQQRSDWPRPFHVWGMVG